MNKHKYIELANNIGREYDKICGKQPCGECKYAFQQDCKILFTLDYLDKQKENSNIANLDNSINKFTITCNECGSNDCEIILTRDYGDEEESFINGYYIRCNNCSNEYIKY